MGMFHTTTLNNAIFLKEQKHMKTCPECHGDKKLMVDCQHCQTTGLVIDYDKNDNEILVTCPVCQGATQYKITCPNCNGKGVVKP
jgi:DnaJ-class molecular chaperone